MLKDDASREEIYEFFPMLEGISEDELISMMDDCEYEGNDEDKPLIHAIKTLLKRMGEDDDEDEDDVAGGSRLPEPSLV